MDAMEIVDKWSGRGFRPTHVVEVGACSLATLHSRVFIESGVKVELVEPQRSAADQLSRELHTLGNVLIHNKAIVQSPGPTLLRCRGASSHTVMERDAPVGALGHDAEHASEIVDGVTFDSIDDGTIDLLLCDVEGAEWDVLVKMISRPRIIVIETHGHAYLNRKLFRIVLWMHKEGYQLLGHDAADTVWANTKALDFGVCSSVSAWAGWLAVILRSCCQLLRRAVSKGAVGCAK